MTGELQHTVVPTYPMVSGEPLSYHWFIYAVQAHLIAAPGVDQMDTVLRMMPALLVPMLISLAAVVGRQLAGRVAAGVLAAALLGVVGNSLATRWVVPTGIPTRWNADGGSWDGLTVYWQDSPPQALGWVAGVAVLGLAVAFVRRAPQDRVAPTWLLVPFLVFAAGAKSSELPVLAAGVALAVLVALVLRDWVQARRAGIVLLAAVGVFGVALLTIYAAGSYGLILQPWGRLAVVVSELTVGVTTVRNAATGARLSAPTSALVVAGIVYLLPSLPRVLGLVLLARVRKAEPALWIPLGTLLGGLVATLMLRHPSDAEVFFLVSAYPVAVVGSAAGFAVGLEPAWRRLSAWSRAAPWSVPAAGAAVGFAVAAGVAYRQPLDSPRPGWLAAAQIGGVVPVSEGEQLWTWLRPHVLLWSGVAVAGVLAALVTVGVRRVRRRGERPVPWSVVGLGLVAAVLGTGCFGTWLHLQSGGVADRKGALAWSAAGERAGALVVTPELIRAGALVRRSSAPDDVVATNRYCLTASPTRVPRPGCVAEDFTVSAFTGRRVDVSGWAYAIQALKGAWTSHVYFTRSAFWNPARLRQENRAFTAPTPLVLAGLWRGHRVRWLVADLKAGPGRRASTGPAGDPAVQRHRDRRLAAASSGRPGLGLLRRWCCRARSRGLEATSGLGANERPHEDDPHRAEHDQAAMVAAADADEHADERQGRRPTPAAGDGGRDAQREQAGQREEQTPEEQGAQGVAVVDGAGDRLDRHGGIPDLGGDDPGPCHPPGTEPAADGGQGHDQREAGDEEGDAQDLAEAVPVVVAGVVHEGDHSGDGEPGAGDQAGDRRRPVAGAGGGARGGQGRHGVAPRRSRCEEADRRSRSGDVASERGPNSGVGVGDDAPSQDHPVGGRRRPVAGPRVAR